MTSTKRTLAAMGAAAMILGGVPSAVVAAPAGPDPMTTILEKLDQLLDAVNGTAPELQGVTQNWDKALPANDPGGPCPNNSSRFTCVFGGAAVRDNTTGLVWETVPKTTTHPWKHDYSNGAPLDARFECHFRKTGGQRGWRLPTVHEIASLADPTQQTTPTLPPGHPFTVPAMYPNYWSVTRSADKGGGGQELAYAMSFEYGYPIPNYVERTYLVWCVRGGTYAHEQ